MINKKSGKPETKQKEASLSILFNNLAPHVKKRDIKLILKNHCKISTLRFHKKKRKEPKPTAETDQNQNQLGSSGDDGSIIPKLQRPDNPQESIIPQLDSAKNSKRGQRGGKEAQSSSQKSKHMFYYYCIITIKSEEDYQKILQRKYYLGASSRSLPLILEAEPLKTAPEEVPEPILLTSDAQDLSRRVYFLHGLPENIIRKDLLGMLRDYEFTDLLEMAILKVNKDGTCNGEARIIFASERDARASLGAFPKEIAGAAITIDYYAETDEYFNQKLSKEIEMERKKRTRKLKKLLKIPKTPKCEGAQLLMEELLLEEEKGDSASRVTRVGSNERGLLVGLNYRFNLGTISRIWQAARAGPGTRGANLGFNTAEWSWNPLSNRSLLFTKKEYNGGFYGNIRQNHNLQASFGGLYQ